MWKDKDESINSRTPCNTKFFDRVANGRRNRKIIMVLKNVGATLDNL